MQKLSIILLLLLPFACLRAQHVFYLPNTMQMPALKQGGDLSISGAMSRGNSMSGMELQAAYALNRYLAFTFNGSRTGNSETFNNLTEKSKYLFGEMAVGLYEPTKRGSAGIFAGYGLGNSYNYFGIDKIVDINLQRIFLQSTVVYEDTYFRAGLSLRLSRLKYRGGKVAVDIPDYYFNSIKLFEDDSPFFLPELGLTAGVRLSPVYLGISIVSIYPRTEQLNFERFNSSATLTLDLGKLFRKKTD